MKRKLFSIVIFFISLVFFSCSLDSGTEGKIVINLPYGRSVASHRGADSESPVSYVFYLRFQNEEANITIDKTGKSDDEIVIDEADPGLWTIKAIACEEEYSEYFDELSKSAGDDFYTMEVSDIGIPYYVGSAEVEVVAGKTAEAELRLRRILQQNERITDFHVEIPEDLVVNFSNYKELLMNLPATATVTTFVGEQEIDSEVIDVEDYKVSDIQKNEFGTVDFTFTYEGVEYVTWLFVEYILPEIEFTKFETTEYQIPQYSEIQFELFEGKAEPEKVIYHTGSVYEESAILEGYVKYEEYRDSYTVGEDWITDGKYFFNEAGNYEVYATREMFSPTLYDENDEVLDYLLTDLIKYKNKYESEKIKIEVCPYELKITQDNAVVSNIQYEKPCQLEFTNKALNPKSEDDLEILNNIKWYFDGEELESSAGVLVIDVPAQTYETQEYRYSAYLIIDENEYELCSYALVIPAINAKPVQVTFNMNGGRVDPEYSNTWDGYVQLYEGQYVADPKIPLINDGYTFDGWYLNDEKYDFENTPVKDSITLTAKWILNSYEIKFDSNSDSEIKSVFVNYGEKLAKPETEPTKDGYRFLGWYLEDEPYNYDSIVTSEFTLTAKWIALYKVTYDLAGGEIADENWKSEVVLEDGDRLSKPEDPVKEGYRFLGWYTENTEYDFDSTVKSDLALTAKWGLDSYEIKFNSNSDSEIKSVFVNYGEKLAKPETEPTKDGYRFLGWYLEDEPYNYDSTVTSDLTLTAKWIALYTVTYDLDGGEIADENWKSEVVLEDGDTLTKPATPVKKGYKFLGWYTENTEYDFDSTVTSDLTLTAKWIALYTVTYDLAGGEIADENWKAEIVLEDGDTLTKPAAPVKKGYKFLGWYTGNAEYGFDSTVTSDLTLTAKWIAVYTVTYDLAGGEIADENWKSEVVLEDGDTLTKPANPVKEGYRFLGWYTGNAEYGFDSTVTSDLTLTAKWIALYTVTYDLDGGEIADESWESEIVVEDGDTLTKPENPVKEGYRFLGWYAGNTEYGFNSTVKSDLTLTAKWIAVYTVTYDLADGAIADESWESEIVVEDGDTLTKPENPVKEGYRFLGWYTGNTEYGFDSTVKSDLTLTAKWIALYTVTYDLNGGEIADESWESEVIVDEGTLLEVTVNPVRNGYVFLGWFIERTAFDFKTPIRESVELTAKWAVESSIELKTLQYSINSVVNGTTTTITVGKYVLDENNEELFITNTAEDEIMSIQWKLNGVLLEDFTDSFSININTATNTYIVSGTNKVTAIITYVDGSVDSLSSDVLVTPGLW